MRNSIALLVVLVTSGVLSGAVQQPDKIAFWDFNPGKEWYEMRFIYQTKQNKKSLAMTMNIITPPFSQGDTIFDCGNGRKSDTTEHQLQGTHRTPDASQYSEGCQVSIFNYLIYFVFLFSIS